MKLLHKRPDMSFVAEVNGLPFHVIYAPAASTASDDDKALYAAALEAESKLENDLPPEAEPEPPPPLNLTAYAADRRWQKEIGGIVVGSIPVATDDRSKLMITGARVAAMADPGWSTVWHGADGNSYPIDVAAMVAISDAVQAHVNATFAAFAAVKAAIEAGEITTAAEVDAAFAA